MGHTLDGARGMTSELSIKEEQQHHPTERAHGDQPTSFSTSADQQFDKTAAVDVHIHLPHRQHLTHPQCHSMLISTS